MTRLILDDNDTSVQYHGIGWVKGGDDWQKTGNPLEFNATTHSSGTHGDTATLQFHGSSIEVYGTLNPSTGQSTLNFSIDGVDAGTSTARAVSAPSFNQHIWTSPILDDTLHTLVITVDHESAITTAKSANRTFHLDYFIYETASALESGAIQFIDDSDAAVIYSSEGWLSSTNGTNDVKNTHHTSILNGAWVAVPFEGNNISLSLTTTNAPVNNVLSTFGASALVDGQQAVFVPQPGLPFTLWLSNTLSSGSHQLNLTVSDVHPIEIDYFMVTGSTVSSSVPSPPPVPSTSAQASTRKNLPVPIIVGGVVGGMIILVLAATCVFLWRRSHACGDQKSKSKGYGGSWLGRWVTRAQIGRESAVLPRPFRLSFRTRRNTQASPPPYRLKYSDGP
ncbi:hypothetical protein R3P38DRAFT_1311199 [Favolaschia claudopus]|uniref:Transmembrane protein n=1 Tax=Favolaschia claudopus TaxID=2862362 RepID=A0AAW0AX98_9AGAR